MCVQETGCNKHRSDVKGGASTQARNNELKKHELTVKESQFYKETCTIFENQQQQQNIQQNQILKG